MKKFFLVALILMQTISLQASEKPSWFKTPAFIASAAATIGSLTALASLWAWSSYKAQLKDVEDAHDTERPQKHNANIQALRDTEKQLEILLKKHDDGSDITDTKATKATLDNIEHLSEQTKVDIKPEIASYRAFYNGDVRTHKLSCYSCQSRDRVGEEHTRCYKFSVPYFKTYTQIIQKGAALETEMERLNDIKDRNPELNKAQSQLNRKLWWTKAVGYTSLAVAGFSIGKLAAQK